MDIAPPDHLRPPLLPGNAFAALATGTLCGSTLLGVVMLVTAFFTNLQNGFGAALSGGMLASILFFLFSLPVWGSGLIVVGLPGWIVLHALGWRSRRAGAAFGAVATFVVTLILGLRLYRSGIEPPWALPLLAGVLALIGAVVGWVMIATACAEKEGAR